jgi:hypothetical protein
MEPGRAFSAASRNISASLLKRRLSKLATTPVTTRLNANIELSGTLALRDVTTVCVLTLAWRWCPQLCTGENSEEEETADVGGGLLVRYHHHHDFCFPHAVVSLLLRV